MFVYRLSPPLSLPFARYFSPNREPVHRLFSLPLTHPLSFVALPLRNRDSRLGAQIAHCFNLHLAGGARFIG